ncbi:MAG: carboxymuconolactone decarboxylase family protein [Chryseolinea sp.]
MEPRINFNDVPKGWYELMQDIETFVKKSGIDHSLINLIKIKASQTNRCGYCLDMHHKDALKEGETIQRMYLLPAWKESPVYSEKEKAVLNLTDVLTSIAHSEPEVVTDAYDKISKHFSKGEIATIVMAICQINSWNRIAIAFGAVPGSYKV